MLQGQTEALRAILEAIPSEDDPTLVEILGRIREHLGEVYRLDRRILRNRRRNVRGLTPDRSGALVISYASSEAGSLFAAFEDWRLEEAMTSDGARDTSVATFSKVLDLLVEHRLSSESRLAKGARLERLAARANNDEIFDTRVNV